MTNQTVTPCPIAPPIAPSSSTLTPPELASVRLLRESTNTAIAMFPKQFEQAWEDRR